VVLKVLCKSYKGIKKTEKNKKKEEKKRREGNGQRQPSPAQLLRPTRSIPELVTVPSLTPPDRWDPTVRVIPNPWPFLLAHEPPPRCHDLLSPPLLPETETASPSRPHLPQHSLCSSPSYFLLESPPSWRIGSPEAAATATEIRRFRWATGIPHPLSGPVRYPLHWRILWCPPFGLMRSESINLSTPEDHRRRLPLQPSLIAVLGRRTRSQSHQRAPRITAHPVVPSPSSMTAGRTHPTKTSHRRRRLFCHRRPPESTLVSLWSIQIQTIRFMKIHWPLLILAMNRYRPMPNSHVAPPEFCLV
jgi:hypothetical protein